MIDDPDKSEPESELEAEVEPEPSAEAALEPAQRQGALGPEPPHPTEAERIAAAHAEDTADDEDLDS